MPALSIDIEARYAQFTDAMSRMERSAKQSFSGIQSAASSLNGSLAGLGVGLSTAGLVAIVKNAIDAADHLNDLSKRTGVAVETLGGIGFAATQAGLDLDGVAKATGKLNLAIADAAGGGKETAAAFRTLKIELDAGNGSLKKADVVLGEIAAKFEKYADGPEKAAIGNKLFGKSYQDIIPLLDDGAQALQDNIDYFQRYSGVTEDVAKKADAFNDTLAKIHLLSGAAGNQIAAELLPTLQLLADKMLEVKESGDGFSPFGKAINTGIEAITALGVNTSYVFKGIGKEIGGIAAQLDALLSADPGGLDREASGFSRISTIAQMMREDAAAARAEVDKTTAEILNPNKIAKLGQGFVPSEISDVLDQKGTLPIIHTGADDPARKKLEAQLRDFERMIDRERDLYGSRKEMLQEFYKQDLIAIDDYYKARQAAANEALAAQQANIDKEIALLTKRKPKDDNEKASNQAKIKDLQDKRAQLEAAANTETTRGLIDRAANAKEFAAQLNAINTELLEMQGRFEKVAAARFDADHAKATQKLSTERAVAVEAGDTDKVAQIDQAQKQLDTLRAASVAQGRLNELQTEAGRIQSDLQITAERVDAAVQAGTIGEIEGLRQVGEARKQAADDLLRMADSFSDAAQSAADPRFAQMAKEFEAAAQKMAKSADLVRDRFQDVFQHGFEGLFDRLLSGTVSLKDAMRGLISEIAADLSRLAIRDLGKGLFSQGGSLGGLVNWAAGLFGARGGVASSATYVGMDWLASAKGNILNAGSLVPFASGGVPDLVNSPHIFPMTGGRTGLLGEAGPEAIMPLHRDHQGELAVKMIGERGAHLLPLTRDASGKLSVRTPKGLEAFANGGVFQNTANLFPSMVAAADSMPGLSAHVMQAVPVKSDERSPINITVNVPQGTSRESADQIATRAALAMTRAQRRNS